MPWSSAQRGSHFQCICQLQGYEDMAEFEDALHGTFEDFLQAMPHLETKIDEKNRLVRSRSLIQPSVVFIHPCVLVWAN
jgi:hypothetical protein